MFIALLQFSFDEATQRRQIVAEEQDADDVSCVRDGMLEIKFCGFAFQSFSRDSMIFATISDLFPPELPLHKPPNNTGYEARCLSLEHTMHILSD